MDTSHFNPTSLLSTGELPSDPWTLPCDPLSGPSAARCRAGSLNVVQVGTLNLTEALPGTWFLRSVRVGLEVGDMSFEGEVASAPETGEVVSPEVGVFMMDELQVWKLELAV